MGFRTVTFVGALVLLMTSCSTANRNNARKVQLINFHIDNALPHCGGAAPLPDDIYPKMDPFISCTLFVFSVNKNGSRDKQLGSILTDNAGNARFPLPKGKYQLWKPSKLLSLDEFQEAEKPAKSSYYTYMDEACFNAWYERPDFEFEVGDKKEFSFAYQNRCFTGAHPCLKYDGPFPP